MRISAAIIAFAFSVSACTREEETPVDPTHFVSVTSLYAKYGCTRMVTNPAMITIDELLKSPATYEGKSVRLEAFYYRSFEHSGLYARMEDGENVNIAHGLWVLEGLPTRYDRKRVTVEGIFTTGTRGHLGQWPGTICNARGYAPR